LAAAPPTLTTLQPGIFRDISQNLIINIVFVGYERGSGPRDIDEARFRAGLPGTYRAIDRYATLYSRYFAGINTYQGLTYNYQYNLVYADNPFEDAFFGYLDSIARPMPPTIYQQAYNFQSVRSLNVSDNAWIDAPAAEQWLASNAG